MYWTEIDNTLLDPQWYVRGDYREAFRLLRDEDAIHGTENTNYGKSYRAISNHADVKKYLLDSRRLINRWDTRVPPTPQRLTPEERHEFAYDVTQSTLDDPAHDLYRRPFSKHFSAPAIGRVRQDDDRIVDETIEEAAARGDELATSKFGEKKLLDYCADGDHANHRVDGDGVSIHELKSHFAGAVVGGMETPRNSAGTGLWFTLTHPAQRAKLQADPGLRHGTVDEALRWATLAKNRLRISNEDSNGRLAVSAPATGSSATSCRRTGTSGPSISRSASTSSEPRTTISRSARGSASASVATSPASSWRSFTRRSSQLSPIWMSSSPTTLP